MTLPRRTLRRDLELEALVERWRAADTGRWQRFSVGTAVGQVALCIALTAVLVGYLIFQDRFQQLPLPDADERATIASTVLIVLGGLAICAAYATIGWPSAQRRRRRMLIAMAYYGTADSVSRWIRWSNFWAVKDLADRSTIVTDPVPHGVRLDTARRLFRFSAVTRTFAAAYAAIAVTASALQAAYLVGAVQSQKPLDVRAASAYAFQDTVWNAVHAVPLLEITETFHLERPAMFAEDPVASVILLIGKLLLFVPIIQTVAALVRGGGNDPTVPAPEGIRAAVVAALADQDARDWPSAVRTAGERLSLPADEVIRRLETASGAA